MEIEKGADTAPLVMDACGWFVSEKHFIHNKTAHLVEYP